MTEDSIGKGSTLCNGHHVVSVMRYEGLRLHQVEARLVASTDNQDQQ